MTSSRRSRALRLTAIAAQAGLLGCGPAASVELTVEDPADLAAGARVVVVRGSDAERVPEQQHPLDEGGLPATITVTAPTATVADLIVEARLTETGAALGRATAQVVPLRVQDPEAVTVALGFPCADAGACDNDTFCDGEETCEQGVCRPGTPPCPPRFPACALDVCVESMQTCAQQARHGECPEAAVDGQLVERYCDLSLGCEPGQACADDGACDDGLQCNGAETCEAGRCVPGELLADDENPCTVDYCVEGSGASHADVPDGVACGAGALLCVGGTCQASDCGDGYADPATGEACDDGPLNSDQEPDACRTDCTAPRCGDGVIDTGETCDDGTGGSCQCDAGP